MDFKKILVSFLIIASLVLLVATVSAASITPNTDTNHLADANSVTVEVDGVSVDLASVHSDVSVNAGDTITVRVEFTSDANASDVIIKAELEGNEGDATDVTSSFPVQVGKTYFKTLTLKVPQVDKNEVSEDMTLNLRIWNANPDFETEVENVLLNVQRTAYDSDFMSVNVDSTIKAGQIVPVEVVLKNTGYNDLDSVTVTAKITALNVQRSAYFGDLTNVAISDSDNPDTVSGKLYLTLPIDAPAGTYALEVTASNDETSSTVTQQVTVQNDYPQTVLQTATGLLIVNPTNNVQVYKIVLPTNAEQLVTVQAGASQTVDVKATEDDYSVSVKTLSGQVLGTFKFNVAQEQTVLARSPIVVLTVILGIVFLVLLVVLVVLISRKPQKSQELGESYY